jgi:hypothetical protein
MRVKAHCSRIEEGRAPYHVEGDINVIVFMGAGKYSLFDN